MERFADLSSACVCAPIHPSSPSTLQDGLNHMSNEPGFLYALVFFGTLLLGWIAWFVFSIFSMRRIERAILAEGKPRPFAWDGVGMRVFGYALRVALPAHRFQNPIEAWDGDILDINRHATAADRVRAWALIILMGLFIATLLLGLLLDL